MLNLAFQGILSFSTKLLYLSIYLGFGIIILSLMLIPYAIIRLINGHLMADWALFIIIVSFLEGLLLFTVGTIGLYIRYMLAETEEFPPYIMKSSNLSDRRR